MSKSGSDAVGDESVRAAVGSESKNEPAGSGAPGDDESTGPESAPGLDEPTANGLQGVGPWHGDLPTEPHFDPELLAKGDTRNVIDRYRYWRLADIVADIDTHRHSFHVAIENWQHDMNIGSIVRSANAFAADTVHIIGRRRWNKRGAMVTDRYQHVQYHTDVTAFAEWAETAGVPIVAVDNIAGAQAMETFAWPQRCVMLFGQEGPGLSEVAREVSPTIVEITQYGSTRSLNAAAAAAITMYSWVLLHGS